MNTITVQTEATSLEQLKSQAITGVIFFDFMSHQFPENGWNDFVVVVLNWWLSALQRMVLGASVNEELRFMDGPFYVNIKKLNSSVCRIECFHEGADGNSEFSDEYQFAELLGNVLKAAEATYSVCYQNGWKGDDVIQLGKLIGELSQ